MYYMKRNSSNVVTDAHSEFNKLTTILKNLETNYTNLELQNKKCLQENNEFKQKISELTEDRLTLKESISNLESQLENSSKKLNDKLIKKKSTILKLNSENKILSEELSEQRSSFKYLRESNKIIPTLNLKIKNTETLLKETSEKLEEKTANCNQLLEENSKIPALNDEIEKLKQELERTENLNYSKLSAENSKVSILNVKIVNLNKKLKQTSLELEREISKCTQLSLDIEGLNDKCKQLTIENSALRAKQDGADQTILELNHNVNVLEQKLKYVTTELEKEIAECTELLAENQKLKSLNEAKKSESEHMTDNRKMEQLEEKLNDLSLELEREITKNNALTEYNKQLDGLIRGFKSKPQTAKLSADSSESLSNSQEQLNNVNNCRVLIRDLPTDQILEPLENTVIVLASKVDMCINRQDITKVSIMKRKGLSEFSQNVSLLLVEFKTSDTKTKFLSSRNKFKYNSSTKFIQVKEFVENDIHSLFMYANKNLRPNGYKRIWFKDNQVFAIKSDSEDEIIEIRSHNHVDELIKPNWRSKNETK